jgi:hypothetical protein
MLLNSLPRMRRTSLNDLLDRGGGRAIADALVILITDKLKEVNSNIALERVIDPV